MPGDPSIKHVRQWLETRYDVVDHSVAIGDSVFSIAGVRDTNVLVDAIDPGQFSADERMPYWSELWTSSIELARYVLAELPLAGASILELGCGLGLAGVAASSAGGRVLMTDYEEDALMFALHNALRNPPSAARGGSIVLQSLDWRVPPALGRFDFVFGADVVYERRNFDPILRLLEDCLRPGGTALFADPDRAIGRDFMALAVQQGFDVADHTLPATRNGPTGTVTIARLCRKEPV